MPIALQVAVGLGCSTVMLIIAARVTLQNPGHTLLIDDVGPLYLIWRVLKNQELKRRIMAVDTLSDTEHLRQAGMMNLDMPIIQSGAPECNSVPRTGYYELPLDDDDDGMSEE